MRGFGARVCADVADSDLFATAGACLAYYELAGRPPPETACRYADLTQASTGTVARSECTDELAAAGLCALGCPCPHGEACFGLSEARSIGVCVDGLLLGFPAPCDPGGVLRAECSNVTPPHACLTARERPEWLERSLWAEDALDAGVDLAGGVCVEAERCARLAALSPETWRCVDLPAL